MYIVLFLVDLLCSKKLAEIYKNFSLSLYDFNHLVGEFSTGFTFQNEFEFYLLVQYLVIKNPWKYISIDRRYFYCIFPTHLTSICEKKISAEVRLIHAEQMSL